jgi:nitrate reductase / nitrite oxidoreductase, alpha subunit
MRPEQVQPPDLGAREGHPHLAREIAANSGRTLVACGMGPNQFFNNDNKDRAIWLVLALTGSLGRHGGNIGSYAGNYKTTLFSGVGLFANEDVFAPQTDPNGRSASGRTCATSRCTTGPTASG